MPAWLEPGTSPLVESTRTVQPGSLPKLPGTRKGNIVTELEHHKPENAAPCGCFSVPRRFLVIHQELGIDENFASISLLTCSVCGQRWLEYFYELESFTASGRWYLGAISPEQASHLTADNAGATLETLDWYFYGGSYYGGRSGKTSGRMNVP